MKYVWPLVIAAFFIFLTSLLQGQPSSLQGQPSLQQGQPFLLQGQSYAQQNPRVRFSLYPRVGAGNLAGSEKLLRHEGEAVAGLFPDDSLQDRVKRVPVPFEGYDPDRTQVRWGRVAIVGTALAATVTAIHIYQRNAWWSDNRCDFHFIEDPDYALNIDKAGHFYGGALSSFIGQKSMEWSGFSRTASVWGGFAIGALFELYVEVEDGYGCDWGFSRGDAYADLAGAAWPVLQYYVPTFQHFQPKYSYWPSDEYLNGIHHGNAIDDYNGQTYWMGVHVHGLLPKTWQDYWPSWLGFAVGLGVRNVGSENPLERHIYISLDYDFTEILPGDSWFLYTLKQALNFIHFPAPAIRISPSGVFYVLYF